VYSVRQHIAIMRWNSEERTFAVEAPVPDRKSIVTWVITFRPDAMNWSPSPENIEAVRASILRSPRRSARKHASALGLSDLMDTWFQQDGATAHTSRASMTVLRKHFP